MATFLLSDHNCEGQVKAIIASLRELGFLELLDLELLFFKDVGLSVNADDEEVWRLCQKQGYYLITANRSTKDGAKSLHSVLQQFSTDTSLPVITLSKPERIILDKRYREACAETLVEIVLNAELYVGVSRLYIP